MGKVTQDLIKEHDAILCALKILDKMIGPSACKTGGKKDIRQESKRELVFFLKIIAG